MVCGIKCAKGEDRIPDYMEMTVGRKLAAKHWGIPVYRLKKWEREGFLVPQLTGRMRCGNGGYTMYYIHENMDRVRHRFLAERKTY